MRFAHPLPGWRDARISARAHLLDLIIWVTAAGLGVVASVAHLHRLADAAVTIGWAFLTLAVIVASGVAAECVGAFRFLARAAIPERASGPVVAGAVLAYTALLSGLINLDVAVVVAVPLALRTAVRNGLPPGRLVLATALTANATSFLLPTSNLTTLLVLSRAPMSWSDYVRHGWVAWLLVTAVTVCGLAAIVGRAGADRSRVAHKPSTRPLLQTLMGLIPLYVGASAIRALLGTAPIQVGGGFVRVAATGSVLTAAVNNIPAAAALAPAGTASLWATVLALAIGPNLLITGSVATLIARQLARADMTNFPIRMFMLLGAIFLPVQMSVALAGLRITGAV